MFLIIYKNKRREERKQKSFFYNIRRNAYNIRILYKTNNRQTIRQKNGKSDLQATVIGVK